MISAEDLLGEAGPAGLGSGARRPTETAHESRMSRSGLGKALLVVRVSVSTPTTAGHASGGADGDDDDHGHAFVPHVVTGLPVCAARPTP